MKAREELSRLATAGPAVVSIGVFDGVHLGHQHLLRLLRAEADRRGCAAAVVTFREHPRTVLRPGEPVSYLSPLEDRLDLLRQAGADLVVPLTFDPELSRLRARGFVEMLREHLGMRGLVVGPDFALGHRREGTIRVLEEMGRELGFTVSVADVLEVGGQPARSTAVRKAVAEGEMGLAARLLGRPFTVPGTVRRGDGRGLGLGFPTANLEVDPALMLPPDGVYATWLQVGREYRPAASSIGVRPTFGPGQRTVEAHVLDFEGDLYGARVRLAFASRLREELRFESVEALVARMHQDVEDTRRALRQAALAPR